ncbi:MAG: hypothetical protein Fur005_34830 [Roseiflexaceae bacterium]
MACADPAYQRASFQDLLDGGANIEFPILVDGEPRSNISVGYREKQWLVVGYGGYWPGFIVSLQEHLAAAGIHDRVDLVVFGVSWATFGMIEHDGQTMVIPLHDAYGMFSTLDFQSNRMYRLDEILTVIHEQAKIVADQSKKQDRRMREELTRMPPQPTMSIPTDEPMPPTSTPGPITTPTPELAPDPGQKGTTEPIVTFTPVP